MLNMRSL